MSTKAFSCPRRNRACATSRALLDCSGCKVLCKAASLVKGASHDKSYFMLTGLEQRPMRQVMDITKTYQSSQIASTVLWSLVKVLVQLVGLDYHAGERKCLPYDGSQGRHREPWILATR